MTEQLANTEPTVAEALVAPTEMEELGSAYDRAIAEGVEQDVVADPAAVAERGPDGKFLAKAQEAAADPVVDPVVDPAAQPDSAAPEHLPQAIKTDWANIPETSRKAIVEHQRDMDRKFGAVGAQLREVKPIVDRFNQAKNVPELANLSHDQIAQGALELAMVQVKLEKAPVETIIEIAQTYGVLDQLTAKMRGEQVQSGGNEQRLMATIRTLEKRLDEVGNPDFIRKNVSGYLEERDAETLVKDLSTGKEFYADVEAHLPAFIQMAWQTLGEGASRNDVFNTAYDMAINAIPSVRAKAQAANQKAAVQPDPKRAESAKKAASINVKSSSNGRERALTEEEAMGSAWERAMAS